MSKTSSLPTGLKLTLELGPLVLFFVANARWGIFAGTAIFMVAVLAALAVSYALTRRLPIMAIVSGVIVTVFGSLTLVLHDETFIKVKPTIIYALFGVDAHVRPHLPQAAARARVRFGVQSDRGRLAQAHRALGAVLLRHGGA